MLFGTAYNSVNYPKCWARIVRLHSGWCSSHCPSTIWYLRCMLVCWRAVAYWAVNGLDLTWSRSNHHCIPATVIRLNDSVGSILDLICWHPQHDGWAGELTANSQSNGLMINLSQAHETCNVFYKRAPALLRSLHSLVKEQTTTWDPIPGQLLFGNHERLGQ